MRFFVWGWLLLFFFVGLAFSEADVSKEAEFVESWSLGTSCSRDADCIRPHMDSARKDVERALELWRSHHNLLSTLLGSAVSDLTAVLAKGSAVKQWESPIDYVPSLSDLDLHLYFKEDFQFSGEVLSSVKEKASSAVDALHLYRSLMDPPKDDVVDPSKEEEESAAPGFHIPVVDLAFPQEMVELNLATFLRPVKTEAYLKYLEEKALLYGKASDLPKDFFSGEAEAEAAVLKKRKEEVCKDQDKAAHPKIHMLPRFVMRSGSVEAFQILKPLVAKLPMAVLELSGVTDAYELSRTAVHKALKENFPDLAQEYSDFYYTAWDAYINYAHFENTPHLKALVDKGMNVVITAREHISALCEKE